MPIILSSDDYDDLIESDYSKIETVDYLDIFETKCTWCNVISQGWYREIHLRDLWLTIEQKQFKEDIVFKNNYTSGEELLFKDNHTSGGPASSFFVTGTMQNCHLGLTQENLEASGGHYLECIHDGVEIDHLFAKEKVVRVRFGLTRNTFAQFAAANDLPRELHPLVNGEIPDAFYRQGKTTSDMQVVLHQILHCPYQGSIKQIYLESKVLELAALQFSQFTEQDCAEPSSLALRPDDIERLHQAKVILQQQSNQPPTLIALARQVGLNDCKLKQGFRQIFGTTVFGYLRDHRLEQARLLLTEGRMSVQQVAHTVGYAQTGYFAKAFKQKFGINPKTYQSQVVRQETGHKKSRYHPKCSRS